VGEARRLRLLRSVSTVRVRHRHIIGLLLVALALASSGCQNGLTAPRWPSFGHRDQSTGLRVEQRVGGGQAVDLKASEIIHIMQRIGFAKEQIVDLGPDLRNAMRATGAAEVMRGGQAEVRLAVNEDHLFVQSRSQGSFVYCLKEQRFVPVPRIPDGSQ